MNPRLPEAPQPAVERHVLAEIDGVAVIIESETDPFPETPEPMELAENPSRAVSEPPKPDVPFDFFAEDFTGSNDIPITTPIPNPNRSARTEAVPVLANLENPAAQIEWELAT